MKSLVTIVVMLSTTLTLSPLAYGRTFTCREIREAANVYGVTALMDYARRNGYTEKQIALYKKCLRKGKKYG